MNRGSAAPSRGPVWSGPRDSRDQFGHRQTEGKPMPKLG